MPTLPSSKQISFLPDDVGAPITTVESALRTALAGGGGGGGTVEPVIAVLGDSISDLNTARTSSWPAIMESVLRQSGDNVRVVNLAKGGSTFQSAMSDTSLGGTTMVAKAIALALP